MTRSFRDVLPHMSNRAVTFLANYLSSNFGDIEELLVDIIDNSDEEDIPRKQLLSELTRVFGSDIEWSSDD